jgi:acyl-coenzyme A thioesterase PaaI-like protein
MSEPSVTRPSVADAPGVRAAVRPSVFDEQLGLRVYKTSAGRMNGRLAVTPDMRGSDGAVKGRIYAVIAESLALAGTILSAAEPLTPYIPKSNATTAVTHTRDGQLVGHAELLHASTTEQCWQVHVFDGTDKLCSTSVVVLAVAEAGSDA